MSKLILASHGELSKGMLNSVSMIVGELADDVQTYSLYPGESPSDYYNHLIEDIKNTEEQYIIVCDIKGGSVHTTLSKLVVYPNVVVLSGMNMNLILDLILTYSKGLCQSDFSVLLQSGKEGMTVLSSSLIDSEDDDF